MHLHFGSQVLLWPIRHCHRTSISIRRTTRDGNRGKSTWMTVNVEHHRFIWSIDVDRLMDSTAIWICGASSGFFAERWAPAQSPANANVCGRISKILHSIPTISGSHTNATIIHHWPFYYISLSACLPTCFRWAHVCLCVCASKWRQWVSLGLFVSSVDKNRLAICRRRFLRACACARYTWIFCWHSKNFSGMCKYACTACQPWYHITENSLSRLLPARM